MGKLGTTEILVILSIALLIFGPSKLPELGKSIGKTIKNFKKGINDIEEINEENA
ncbi:twin-arginine translocase TatA/TatE family subunit [Alkalibaculum sp. M08DMB]|uniref:Sec-independent protein translocase protein TatA n=1 Tax=Alkalibaculum sporogenes TaxID=2655001 RepID=A0A6A7K8Q2_9FIRM|nr:twin-arginine translocase TatA/TatE family subunit [Alkalibaculum sporogenes]